MVDVGVDLEAHCFAVARALIGSYHQPLPATIQLLCNARNWIRSLLQNLDALSSHISHDGAASTLTDNSTQRRHLVSAVANLTETSFGTGSAPAGSALPILIWTAAFRSRHVGNPSPSHPT